MVEVWPSWWMPKARVDKNAKLEERIIIGVILLAWAGAVVMMVALHLAGMLK